MKQENTWKQYSEQQLEELESLSVRYIWTPERPNASASEKRCASQRSMATGIWRKL